MKTIVLYAVIAVSLSVVSVFSLNRASGHDSVESWNRTASAFHLPKLKTEGIYVGAFMPAKEI